LLELCTQDALKAKSEKVKIGWVRREMKGIGGD
jgi:hypothetical protein